MCLIVVHCFDLHFCIVMKKLYLLGSHVCTPSPVLPPQAVRPRPQRSYEQWRAEKCGHVARHSKHILFLQQLKSGGVEHVPVRTRQPDQWEILLCRWTWPFSSPNEAVASDNNT